MRFKVRTTIFAFVLVAGFAALALSLSAGGASVSASEARNGQLHATKECSQYNGNAGDFCTITSSNLSEIPLKARVFYDQAAGIPCAAAGCPANPPIVNPLPGMLDSNTVLYAGIGDWAVGRCTLDGNTGNGLCTFSDGVGRLAGFSARLKVTYTSGVNYSWDGTYSFSPEPGK